MFNYHIEDIYENSQIHNTNNYVKKFERAKIELILTNLKKAKEYNILLQQNIYNKFLYYDNKKKENLKLLEKIKRIQKSKPKKHIKYNIYIPLSYIYYYTSKKIHIYYNLLEEVINSCKKSDDNQIIKSNTNRFKFTKSEDGILKNLIFFNHNNSNNLVNWLTISEEMNKIINKDSLKNDFLSEENCEKSKNKIFTPLKCFVRYLETSNFYKYKKWSDNEDKILKISILYYGPKNWQQISYCLDGRNNSQCFHRWMKGINPKIKRDKWSFLEDLTLGLALTKIYGYKKWSKIANHLPGRTDIQCRERWCNILDPTLEEVEWTEEEDMKLLNLNREFGNKWSKIAKEFGNRTDNTCWRRWKYLTSNINNNIKDNIKDLDSDKNKKIIFKVVK